MKIRLAATALSLLVSSTATAAEVSADTQQMWQCVGVFDAVATAEQQQRRLISYRRFQALTQQARGAVLTANPQWADMAPQELLALQERAREQTMALFREGHNSQVYSQALGCFQDLTQYSQEPQS